MPASVHVRVPKMHRLSDGTISQGVSDAIMDAADAGHSRAIELVPYGVSGDLQRGLINNGPTRQSDGSVTWGSSAPYTLPVEYGSRPHWIPINAMPGLEQWARIVLGDEGAAWAVRHKIAMQGTDPQPFIRPGVERMRSVLRGTGIATYIRDHIPP